MGNEEKIYDLENYLQDGRLTEMPDGKKRYDVRRMAERTRVLGRPLTGEEAKRYLI